MFNKKTPEEIRLEEEIERRRNYNGDLVCPYCEGTLSDKMPNIPLERWFEITRVSMICCPHCKKVLAGSSEE